MFGRKNSVNTRPFQARNMENSSMVGTGFAMEGIHNSYVMYDLLSEMNWRTQPISNLTKWFEVRIILRRPPASQSDLSLKSTEKWQSST